MLEIGASGSVGGEGGNILAYPANVGIIRSPVRASILPDRQLIREMSVANPLWGAPPHPR
jgi:hypothetical protein